MSVDWGELRAAKETAQYWLSRWDRVGVALITAQLCWDLGQIVNRDPVPGNDAHCGVVGEKDDITRDIFARTATLLMDVRRG